MNRRGLLKAIIAAPLAAIGVKAGQSLECVEPMSPAAMEAAQVVNVSTYQYAAVELEALSELKDWGVWMQMGKPITEYRGTINIPRITMPTFAKDASSG